MNTLLKLEVLTPERKLLETEADSVTLPGIMGELGILPNHLPLMTTLQPGALSYKYGTQHGLFVVHSGYVQVIENHVTVLAKIAEKAEDIDVERAERARDKAVESLRSSSVKSDAEGDRIDMMEFKLKRAIARLEVSKMLKK